MSHYIQDNQCIVKTKDDKILFFVKGGDNNTYSWHNRRVTNWWFQGIYKNEKSFRIFLDELMKKSINGGSWQFNSLKNKIFEGFTEYQAIVYKRFDKAIKKALFLDLSMDEITENNIEKYEYAINSLMNKAKFVLKDEEGYYNPVRLYSREYDKDDILKRVKDVKEFKENKYEGYKDFCLKYEKISIFEGLKDNEFCKAY